MDKVFIILAVLGLAQSSPVEPNVILNNDGSYKFNFDTGKDHGSIVRHEERLADGTVVGRYSYEDPNGAVRVVNYRAGRQGFIATGDVGVDGAPPAQVPIVIPQVPEEDPDEGDQNLQDIQNPNQDAEGPDTSGITGDVDKHDGSSVTESPRGTTSPVPKDETIKVAIPDDAGRKREAGSPPVSYSDNFFPFQTPTFGKRRLEVPEDDDKTSSDDDTDKKQDPVQPPTSYISDSINPVKPHKQNTGSIDGVKPVHVANPNPQGYYFYVPVQTPFGFFPGSQSSQPSNPPNQHQSGGPSAWAYVPVSAFPQHNSVGLAPQPFAPPTNWGFGQRQPVRYVPGGNGEPVTPVLSPSAPQPPTPSTSGDPNGQDHISPIPDGPTNNPTDENSPLTPENVVPQGEIQPGFQRPTVQHYHFRGPSHTYGYYYQY